jgi:DNA-directed RNA polymerase subunit RPC12/RpoP
MKMQKLSCPSCGSHLELPENLEVAHCLYCGTKILLREPETSKEGLNTDVYHELIMSAYKENNHAEVIQYCIKILEIDPEDVDAWIDLALATYLNNPETPGIENAFRYLSNASKLSPNDESIKEVEQLLIEKQVEQQVEQQFGSLYGQGHSIFIDGAMNYWYQMRIFQFDEKIAQEATEPDFKWAMDLLIKALELKPGNPELIRDIKRLMLEAYWIEWSESDLLKAGLVDEIDTIKEYAKKLHALYLEQEKIDLNQGYFGRAKRSARRTELGWEIRELERIVLDNNKSEK